MDPRPRGDDNSGLVLLLASALLLSACAPPPQAGPAPPPGPDRQLVARVTGMAAAQVKRCYRAPSGYAQAKREISTVLAVRYGPDGMLLGLPVLLRQSGVTPANEAAAPRVAEAASMAVIACQPLRLPPELYDGGWDDFELTFSPGMAA